MVIVLLLPTAQLSGTFPLWQAAIIAFHELFAKVASKITGAFPRLVKNTLMVSPRCKCAGTGVVVVFFLHLVVETGHAVGIVARPVISDKISVVINLA